jgi:hypothetical protein
LAADVDYEVEYNNRARVPENPVIIAPLADPNSPMKLRLKQLAGR